ncbi:hypothetical protein GQR60_06420 [Labilibaculum sp. A4]|uniref:Outer membrane beta-barrel protein n=1 Tax=Labilibaculum euxinus TaxID=2686357 RepID=A0A425YDJ7_9BACT|nr:hypothetical protein [Labilibaculum euxinus]MDQ1770795.1 hypothetical protein [Labilibaculum euxinus]MUP38664.1 hypothetical protein [Labilibaculum euxinus]MVB07869.1 hypothetical protein [Labilibaculum euxinus]MWN75964.1 hypothetical protein [Labilibaculum euxinus]
MKKTVILLIALTLSTFVMAQEKTKIKEVGLTFRNLDEFGFGYKIGTEQSLWRFNTIFLSGMNEDRNSDKAFNDSDSQQFGLSFSAGKEYRKLITENLEYRYGLDLSFGYNHSKENNGSTTDPSKRKSNLFTPGLNLVFGLNYIISDQLILGAEVLPYLKYTFGQTSEERRIPEYSNKVDHSDIRYGFDSSSVLLSLAYRF